MSQPIPPCPEPDPIRVAHLALLVLRSALGSQLSGPVAGYVFPPDETIYSLEEAAELLTVLSKPVVCRATARGLVVSVECGPVAGDPVATLHRETRAKFIARRVQASRRVNPLPFDRDQSFQALVGALHPEHRETWLMEWRGTQEVLTVTMADYGAWLRDYYVSPHYYRGLGVQPVASSQAQSIGAGVPHVAHVFECAEVPATPLIEFHAPAG